MPDNKENKTRPGTVRVTAYLSEDLHKRLLLRAQGETNQDIIVRLVRQWVDGVPLHAPEVSDDEMAVFEGMVNWIREQQESGQAGFWSALIEEWMQRGRRIRS